jgi:hypothetical protein
VAGDAYDVEVVDTGGAGPATVALVGSTLTIDLVGLTPTEDQIASLINVAAAGWTGLLRAHSGGGAAFGIVALANLAGGAGAGITVRAGNGVCTFVGQTGAGTTSDASASCQATVIYANPPALTGLTPALQAADACAISVLSGTKSSQSVAIVLA